ncbi:hypothetical protein M409DRAFT_17669 [Zasmidium cellare ATCC 36951]|uniref:Probable Xaa-Pro aminopeptidase P n=1 Tax=Zasmidium cellare ATCC 36951 TaxID=1080233 RepID=A0A6A6D452_ZASCE|nr:uncharacterized protein M409DRAFT_17669 [Zasmidium cellare ATCC 36951]KAF2172436.1 hypothetical protein M409DRAFT_17669 [Zasmidium cellare ATCC 36951]
MSITKQSALPPWAQPQQNERKRRYLDWLPIVAVLALGALWLFKSSITESFNARCSGTDPEISLKLEKHPSLPLKDIPKHLRSFQDCSIKNLQANLSFLDTAHPLPVAEFVHRRDRLAQALVEDGLDAFLVEPGYTFSYYANVTQPDWEVWEPEERPFLMVVQPQSHGSTYKAKTTFLVPSFEAERARLLNMPFESEIELVTYEEHWNPYTTLLSSSIFSTAKTAPKVMVDEEMRDFISRGLADNGFNVHGLNGEVERVRETKSEAEIGILRAVNTGTVESVRAMRKCMKPGLTEDEVMWVLDNTMRSAGMDPFFDIVLFDEDASNPHGGTDGSKILEKETMVLIDVGSHLFGYSSDICRSFFPPFFEKPESDHDYEALSSELKEKLYVWDVVLEAQTASLHALHENGTCASVDLAARGVIEDAGYGDAFTHRVGHGIGIKAHESPYLNKGNVDTKLKAGMTFTSEPGIYLVDKFGVRHEDILLVRENGLPDLLTGQRAQGPWDP